MYTIKVYEDNKLTAEHTAETRAEFKTKYEELNTPNVELVCEYTYKVIFNGSMIDHIKF